VAKCNPQSQQIKHYAGGGTVRSGTPGRRDTDPIPGTKGPNASRPRGSTGGGLNSLPSSPTTDRPTNSSADTRLNPRALDMEPRRNINAFKKGGIVASKKPSSSPFLPGAARRMGAQFGAAAGKSAEKPAGNPFAKKTASGPVKASKAAKGPVRKKFI
jgi:hypothetical protein